MQAVEYRAWPKPTLRRQVGLVARIKADFDAIAASLSAKPKTFAHRATKTDHEIKYRSIFLILSNGAPAALTEYLQKAGSIELSLQVERDRFAFDDDYAEVVRELRLSAAQVEKFEGNFTWLPDRKAKRVEPEEDSLPEDWWNQVRVLPASKTSRKR